MPIKNPLKKTFAQKRKALGVDREFNDTRTNLVGSMRVTTHPSRRQANPKIRQIETLSSIEIDGIKNKLIDLSAFKPKNEMEARKKNEAILKLNEKLKNAEISKMDFISTIEIKRKQAREKRQTQIIEKKLLSIVKESSVFKTNSQKANRTHILSHKYNSYELRNNYQNFLKRNNKSFADLTANDVVEIFGNTTRRKK